MAAEGASMRVELVMIGNELLNGDLADTNTRRFGERLREMGLRIAGSRTVPDELGPIVEAFKAASVAATVVLVSGGLGPTSDDLTLRAAAQFAGVPVVLHAPTLERLKARFAARGFPFTANNEQQAWVPEGADVFDNPVGTAPHVQLQHGSTRFFFFPGVPHELARLVADYLVPWLEGSGHASAYSSLRFKTFGKTESQVATALAALEAHPDPRLHVAYRAHFPEIHVSLHAYHDSPDEIATALEAAEALCIEALGDLIFARDAKTTMAEVVGGLLHARHETVAVAESCTGGLIGGAITGVPGSSGWFQRGFITYANEAKTELLGVPTDLLAAHGAVSVEVASAMAVGARERSGADWAISVTGIAGPDGGSDDKPVGTVFFGLAGPSGVTTTRRRFPFDRERNRIVSVHTALDILRKALI